jgi:HEAT repeat protein
MRSVVERYLVEADTSARAPLPTAGQVMTVIEQSRLRLCCRTPLYLFALLDTLGALDPARFLLLDTRGRLLAAFLRDRLGLDPLARESEVRSPELFFLGNLACVARWNGDDDFIALPAGSFLATDGQAAAGSGSLDILRTWLSEQEVPFPLEPENAFPLAEVADPDEAMVFLQRLQEASLLEIDEQGVLHMRHRILASALVALYLGHFLGTSTLNLNVLEQFPDDLAPWSEPLAMWAGLLDHPEEAAAQLAGYASRVPEARTEALLTSLICLGVAQQPAPASPVPVPAELETALRETLANPGELALLASSFKECARRGTPELYEALFSLLTIAGYEELLVLLDAPLVAARFFQRLVDVIDEPSQEELVKRLVRALSCWGGVVVPTASNLCSANSQSGTRLRTAAINILGGTRHTTAVDPLLECLRDSDQFIVRRAANALLRLGPDLALLRLVQELEMRTPANRHQPLHWIILPVLERFLNETDPTRQLKSEQAERIIAALLHVQATHDVLADVEKARDILVNHGRQAPERDSGKIAISLLVQNLGTADDAVARSMTGTLKEVGEVATPHLLEQLESQISEAERVRILEILASIRDLRALPALLRLLEDPSLLIQQALVRALSAYTPECIPGLIETTLHHRSELVAARAEQVLCGLGPLVVDPVVEQLAAKQTGRVALLVHVLSSVRDPRAVPALLSLLQRAQTEVALALSCIEALGQCNDERAVKPLLDLLNGPNALICEGAINALSSLGDLTCPALLPLLDTPETTPLVRKLASILLIMQPFPAEHLLRLMDQGSAAQLRHLDEILLARGADAAQLLAVNLFHPLPRVREHVRQVLERMDARYIVPALLELLTRPDPDWQELIARYLLKHPREAIPPLVGLLDDRERGEMAERMLQQAGQPVLAALIPALETSPGLAGERASRILVTLAQQQPELLPDVVQLFGLALPARAHQTLQGLLAQELASASLPALLDGLEDAHLVPDVTEVLVRQARQNSERQAIVLDALLQALRQETQRHGASVALIMLSGIAVSRVGACITDPDPQVAHTARHILIEIGAPALSFIWAAQSDASDPARREAAREVFHAMPTTVIKDELVTLLTSAHQDELAMALALLLERIHEEEEQPGRAGEMLPALLEHVQTSANESASLRILALLILLGGPIVATALIDALYSNARRHEHLMQAFLLLGQGVETDLLAILRDGDAPVELQAEVAGVLAMRTPHRDIRERARRLSESGLWAAQSETVPLVPAQLEISLRALGGLLVGGHWPVQELLNLRASSPQGSPERELYSTLLGWHYEPQIQGLQQRLESLREELTREKAALVKMHVEAMERDLELQDLKKEHQSQSLVHQQAAKENEQKVREQEATIARLTREKQTLQSGLTQLQQEKQTLQGKAQQASQERDKALADARQWQAYGERLAQENMSLRKPGLNP